MSILRTVSALLLTTFTPLVFADDWQAFTDSDVGFTVQFPGTPAVETSKVRSAAGFAVPVTRYSLHQEGILYSLTVSNYSNTNADALDTITATVRAIDATTQVTADVRSRVGASFGRRLSAIRRDGSHSALAVFFVNQHLYVLDGQALPPAPDARAADAVRFQESLQFLDDNGGFLAFFRRGGPARPAVAPAVAAPAAVAAVATGRPAPAVSSADPCAGKSPGDAVQMETPNGSVRATCVLVPRPDAPMPKAH